MGLICRLEKKAAAVFPQPRTDDSDAEQSGTKSAIHEGRSDRNESLRLSSGCTTPLLLSNGCPPPDAVQLDTWDPSPDDQFCLVQSISFSDILDRICVFDGSRISPLEEASLVLDGTPDDITNVCEEDVQAGEVVAWLRNSLESEINDSSFTCAESTESSYESSLFEDLSVLDSSLSSLSKSEDSYFQFCDFDIADMWVSGLDLEGEYCKWESDKMLNFDVLPPDFPSPPFHAKKNPYFKLSDYRNAFSKENSIADLFSDPTSQAKEHFLCEEPEGSSKLDLERFNADEPLFWPFDQNSDWHPEIDWCWLSISPRRDMGFFGKKSASLRLPEKRGSLLQRKALKGGQARRNLFESRSSMTSISSCKTKDGNKKVTVIGSKPSRLSRFTCCSSEQHFHCVSMKSSPTKMKEKPSQTSSVEVLPSHLQQQVPGQDELQLNKNLNKFVKISTEKSTKTKNDEPDELTQPSLETFAEADQEFLSEGLDSSEEAPVEAFVGLNEFNGHEGIDTECDEGVFSFDGL